MLYVAEMSAMSVKLSLQKEAILNLTGFEKLLR